MSERWGLSPNLAQMSEKRGLSLNLANWLSGLRLLLAVPICWLIAKPERGQDGVLVALIAIAVLSDFFDGLVSRKLHQETELGKMLDPIADKVVIVSGIIAAVLFRGFPALVALWQAYRDLVIIALGIPMSRRSGRVVAANRWGKLNTVVVSLLCLSFIGAPEFLATRVLTYAALATLWISSISYYVRAEPVLLSSEWAKLLLRIALFAGAILLWRAGVKLAPDMQWL